MTTPEIERRPAALWKAMTEAQRQAAAERPGAFAGALGEADAAGEFHLARGLRVHRGREQECRGDSCERQPGVGMFCGRHGTNLR